MLSRTSVLVSLLLVTTLAPISAHALVYAEDLPILFAEDIEIVDGLAYVVTDRSPIPDTPTLRILDLSDPNSPVEVGSLDTSVGAQDVEVVGELAYLTDHALAGKMRIIDVSDPAAPVEIGAFVSEFEPVDVEVVGNFAYLADWFYTPQGCSGGGPYPCGAAFRVIDVSDPTAPVQISERFMNLTFDMEAVEGVVYLSGRDLEVIDVSDPTTPVRIGLVSEVGASDIAVVDEHVYTTATQPFLDPSTGEPYTLQVINVTDPSNPFPVGRELATGVSIEVVDGFAYTGGQDGMSVVDVSDPTAPARLGSIYSQDLKDLEVYAGRAYLATYDGPVKVVDLSVLDTPVEVGWAAAEGPDGEPGIANDVEISDGIAYLALGDDRSFQYPAKGLSTIDVSNPATPTPLGGIDTAEVALDVELVGGLAVVAADIGGLKAFDVTNPSAPVAAGGLALPGSTAKLEVAGTTAYVVDRGISREAFRALRIIDVSNAAAPVELGAVEFSDSQFACWVPGIAVVEKLAYVTCRGLYIVDISDPAQPTLIFAERMNNYESSIQVAGDQAYIGDDQFSPPFLTYDISDPTLPVQVSVADGGGRSMLVEDGFAYSAGQQGLAVHDLADPRQPVLMGGYPSDRGPWRSLAIADGLIYGAGNGGLQIVDLGPEYLHTRPVEIAIRADGGSAVVNLASRGVVPVTVLGAADFDVAEIDRATLRFGPAAAAPVHKLGGHLNDVNGDGRPDLLSHYWIGDTGISQATENACVQGETLAGNSFEGCGLLEVILPQGQLDASNLAN